MGYIKRDLEDEIIAVSREYHGSFQAKNTDNKGVCLNGILSTERRDAYMAENTHIKTKRLVLGCLLAAAVILVACAVYVGDYYRADETAGKALVSDEAVSVEQKKDMVVFKPRATSSVGFIFYPGGKVEYTSYSPPMHQLAQQGVQCFLLKMPFNLAVLDVNAADGIPEKYSEIDQWYIGGHSLGGSMATSYAAKHPDALEGLVLLAAYSTEDLSSSGMQALSLYGTEDGVLNFEKYGKYRENLPADTAEVILDGGNHACFGSYGSQKGDGTAELSGEEQTTQAADAIAVFIASCS